MRINTKNNNKKNIGKNAKVPYHSYKMQKNEKKTLNKKNVRKSAREDNFQEKKIKNKESRLKLSQDKKKEKIRLREEKNIKKENNKLKKAKKIENFKKSIFKTLKTDAFFIIIGIALIISMLSFITFRQSAISDIKYSINKKNTDIHNIDNEIRVEILKIDEASRSDVIEQKAIENLKMQYRNHQQIEYIMVE